MSSARVAESMRAAIAPMPSRALAAADRRRIAPGLRATRRCPWKSEASVVCGDFGTSSRKGGSARMSALGGAHHRHAALAHVHARGDAADFCNRAAEQRLVDVGVEVAIVPVLRAGRWLTSAALAAPGSPAGRPGAPPGRRVRRGHRSRPRGDRACAPARAAGRRAAVRGTAPDRQRRETPRSRGPPTSDGAGHRPFRRDSSSR